MLTSLPEQSASIPSAESSSSETHQVKSQSASAQREVGTLPHILTTRDMTIFLLLIVLFISNSNGVQFGGPATFIYWGLGLLTFFLPSAFVTQWLARRFPGQGAPYLWATYVFGANWSFFAAFCAWVPGVLSVVSAIEAGIVFVQYLYPTWFTTPMQQCLAILLVLIVGTALTCIPLRRLKLVLGILAVIYVGVYLLQGAAGAYWLLQGHAAAMTFNQTSGWQLNGGNFAIYGLVVLALLGIDVPLFMGGEIRGGNAGIHKVSRYVWWGVAISMLAYISSTFGIMVVVPPAQAGSMSANIQAVAMVFGPTLGNVVALMLAGSQLTITIAYILMFSRLLVLVAQDRRLPGALARVNRHGVPVLSIVVQGAIVACVAVVSFVVIPVLFGNVMRPEDLAVEIYNILLAGATALWSSSTALLFFFVLKLLLRSKSLLRTSGRGETETSRDKALSSADIAKKERWLLLALALVGSVSSILGIWSTLSSSWIPTLISNGRWSVLVSVSVLLSFAIGWIGSELPRMHALLSEQRRVNDREVGLRQQLEEAYTEQQLLLAEVDRLYREQAQAAVTDAITGLPNHRAIMSRLEEELDACRKGERSCAVVFVDLDHFKQVNDTWGHRAGDAILREVGRRLRDGLRQQDFVGRYGGEEFAVVLSDTDFASAQIVAERLREDIAAQPYMWTAEDTQAALPIQVTGSFGVAIYQLHGLTREELVENADKAMYKAKHSGRNRVCLPEDERQGEHRARTANPVRIESSIQTVQALSAAASARDQGTDEHAHRMIALAEATARQLGQSEEELHLLRLAALLHDIGKIGIPDTILHKPGPLTDEEWKIMRQHPEIGREILVKTGGIFQHLGTIVVSHHERWDGRGYPKGIAGEEIPLDARILSVVDSFDAMTSRRAYRAPMPVAQARTELQRCSNSQFDPRVVDAFLHALDEQERQSELDAAQSGELVRV